MKPSIKARDGLNLVSYINVPDGTGRRYDGAARSMWAVGADFWGSIQRAVASETRKCGLQGNTGVQRRRQRRS